MDAWSFQPMIGQTSLHLTWKKWLAYRCTITFDVTPLNQELCMSRNMRHLWRLTWWSPIHIGHHFWRSCPQSFLPRVLQRRGSGTFMTPFVRFVRFVLVVIKILLVLCLMSPSQAMDKARQLDAHRHFLKMTSTPPSKWRCLCGICRQEGHNCYSCPNKEA